MYQIDLNCDLGEIEDPEGTILDAALMPYVSSINIACGGHAGNPDRIRRVVEQALTLNIAVGAHPGYADRTNFGRVVVPMSLLDVHNLVLQQISLVANIANECGGKLHHVKPHGALYNLAATSPEISHSIATAVLALDPHCRLMGLSGSCLTDAATAVGLPAVHEVFADRNYQADGSLVPRNADDAVLHDPEQIAVRAAAIVQTGVVKAIDGTRLSFPRDTLCIHSDTPNAVATAEKIRQVFGRQGIVVQAVD
jgi:UPF0271 protein